MNYEILKSDNPYTKETYEYVLITREDGSFESFPVDENNSRYLAWLEENK